MKNKNKFDPDFHQGAKGCWNCEEPAGGSHLEGSKTVGF
jgi:hypothetical protein